ncbi:LppX_LprAFG lipoprotein [Nocardioides sp. YIM 152315]|uniref:LppX_LprAFG lipoprotein n=1 Tax=Nocardioides sp. YIM 152315 TaxID=3031760 RepID=UPI0023DA3F38|nr:LppX_LprAFG lipoprotein [Nocardioides sp. YIM 152315]MDF1605486.1 LppX_LprAFG lipoprotein [Nocardioides sp. YIM 152315]
MIVSTTARRTLAAAAIAPLLLTGFAACGDDGDDSGSGADSGGSAAGSLILADLSEGEEVAPDEFVDTVAAGLEESTTAHMEMTMSMGEQFSAESEGDLDYTSDPPSMQMSMDIPGVGDMEMVMVDGVIYMKSAAMSGDKYWKIDLSDPDSPLGKMGFDKLLEQSDPVGALESMKDGIDTVTFEGSEDVDGRELDHYELTIDMQSAMDTLGGDLPSEATKAMPESVTYDLWLDDEDRFAQMQMETPVMDQTMDMEMSLDDWGQDVSVEAPPADEITDMPDLGQMMGGTSSGSALAG